VLRAHEPDARPALIRHHEVHDDKTCRRQLTLQIGGRVMAQPSALPALPPAERIGSVADGVAQDSRGVLLGQPAEEYAKRLDVLQQTEAAHHVERLRRQRLPHVELNDRTALRPYVERRVTLVASKPRSKGSGQPLVAGAKVRDEQARATGGRDGVEVRRQQRHRGRRPLLPPRGAGVVEVVREP
jgi:hypothetical protein